MKKLSNQQIEAIAYDIKNKVQKANIKHNEVNKKVKHAAFFKTEKGKLALKFHKTFDFPLSDHFLNQNSGFEPKANYLDLQTVKNKVLLAIIDCKDYTDLSDKLLKEFLK